MRGPMKVIDGSSGLMDCRVCENRHYGNLQSGYLRADGITRMYRGSYQCSWDQCPSNQKMWDESKQRYLKPNWRKLVQAAAANENFQRGAASEDVCKVTEHPRQPDSVEISKD